MNILFSDKRLDTKFKEDGFVVVPFVSEDRLFELKKVLKYYCEDKVSSQSGLFYSLLENDITENQLIKNEIEKILLPAYNSLFQNFRSVAESFLVKPPASEPLLLHQDWTNTDEEKYCSATLWCPLTDVNANTGALFAVKGSHRFFKNYRSGSLPSSRIHTWGEIEKYVEHIETKPGDAVVFHPALFHGSYPNETNLQRAVAASLILPKDTPHFYFHLSANEKVELYRMSEQDFFESIKPLSGGSVKPNGIPTKTLSYRHKIPNTQELLEKIVSSKSLSDAELMR